MNEADSTHPPQGVDEAHPEAPLLDDDALRDFERIEERFLTSLERGESPNIDAFVTGESPYADELRLRLGAVRMLFDFQESQRGEPVATVTREERLPDRIDRYTIVDRLGEGGPCVVLRAFDPVLERTVAIKLMRQALPAGSEFLERFAREARVLARLRHAHIVPVYDSGVWQGQPYLVMEFVSGSTLDDELTRHEGRPIDFRRTADLIRKMAEALHFAHTRRIIHRDIKPSNILLDDLGEPQLADFGLALLDAEGIAVDRRMDSLSVSVRRGSTVTDDRPTEGLPVGGLPIPFEETSGQAGTGSTDCQSVRNETPIGGVDSTTESGPTVDADVRADNPHYDNEEDGATSLTFTHQLLGTPAYMSPEQAAGRAAEADARSDVFSLGVVFYRMLTGHRPFTGSVDELREQVQNVDPRRPRLWHSSIPADLETICLKSLSKAPQARYETAQLMADELRRWLDGEPLAITPPSFGGRIIGWSRRNPATAGFGLTAAFLLMLALAASAVAYVRGREAVVLRQNQAEIRARRLIDVGKRQLSRSDLGRVSAVQQRILPEILSSLQALPSGTALDELQVEARSLYCESLGAIEVRIEYPPQLPATTPGLPWPVALHPSGRWMVVGNSDRPIRIDRVEPFAIPKDVVNRFPQPKVAYSRSGRLLAFASADGNVELWNETARECLARWRCDRESAPLAIGFDEAEKEVRLCSTDGLLRVFSTEEHAATPRSVVPLNDFPQSRSTARFSPRGGRLAVGNSRGSVRVYSMTGQIAQHFVADPQAVQSLGWSDDESWLACGQKGGGIALHDVPTGAIRHRFKIGTDIVGSVVFSPDGLWLAAGSPGIGGKIWDIFSGNLVVSGGMSIPVGFSDDSRTVAASSHMVIEFCDLRIPTAIRRLSGHQAAIEHLVWSGNGCRLATLDTRLVLKVWDAEPGAAVGDLTFFTEDTYAQNAGIALNDDGSQVGVAVSSRTAGSLRIHDFRRNLDQEWKLASGCDRLAHIGNDRFLSAREEGCQWDSGPCATVLREFSIGREPGLPRVLRHSTDGDSGFIHQSLTRDGRHYLWIGPRRPVAVYRTELWDVAQSKLISQTVNHVPPTIRSSEPTAIVSESGRLLWTNYINASGDERALINLEDGNESRKVTSTSIPCGISHDERWVVRVEPSGDYSHDFEIHLCRFGEARCWVRFAIRDGKHTSANAVAFSPDGRYLAWGSQSGELTLVDLPLLQQKVDEFEKSYRTK